MTQETVERWEDELTPEQRERLAGLRARKCQVEAVFVPADAPKGIAAHARFTVTIDSVLLALRNEPRDLRAAFDALSHDAMVKLTLPESTRPSLD